MIMHDGQYGFRDLHSWKRFGEVEWLEWDYVLVEALQLIEDYTTDSGLLAWEADSDRVEVEAVRFTDKFEAARERSTSRKNYKAIPGERYRPRVKLRRGEDWPTFEEWVESQVTE